MVLKLNWVKWLFGRCSGPDTRAETRVAVQGVSMSNWMSDEGSWIRFRGWITFMQTIGG